MKSEKDTENKKFIENVLKKVALVGVAVASTAAAVLGAQTRISILSAAGNEEGENLDELNVIEDDDNNKV